MSASAELGASANVVEISGLAIEYNRHGHRNQAVAGVDLNIARGERVAIVGESGSGKTTVAMSIMGLLAPSARITAGEITVAGTAMAGRREGAWRGIRGAVVGLVPQDPMVALNPTQRIGPQVGEAIRRHRGVDKRSLSAEVVEALERAGLDDGVVRARQYPHELSGGMRQRVLIAIALAGNPQLIIADEPTSALDVTTQKRVLDHLDTLVRDTGTSLLLITHDLGVAADRADRVLVMRSGEIVEHGRPEKVLVAPEHEYSRALVAAVPAFGTVQPVPTHEGAAAILRLENLTKDFALPRSADGPRTMRAVDDLSLEVLKGQTTAIVGESGSGKTTTLRMALGLEQPSSGRVVFDGEEISGRSWRQLRELRRRVPLVHQNPFASLDPRFTVRDTIAEPLVSFRVGNSRARAERVRALLDLVALPDSFGLRKPAELSGGQRQRVAIARALALEPEVVLLDEPVSALDVSVQARILDLLRRLQVELGLSYLFISHDLAVVAQLAHQVTVMQKGHVVEQGPTDTVLTKPQTEYTQKLLAAVPGRERVGALRNAKD
jgi:peptide/nickel transport system ATP-binding protein